MNFNKKFLCIVPARGGSKGLKNKNLLKINGIPLVLWPINAAKKVKYIDKIILSSNSKKILNIAKNRNIILESRSKRLSTDRSSTYSVIENILKKKIYKSYKYLICLEPTSPFTTSKEINKSIKMFLSKNAGSLVSIAEANQSNPNFLFYKNQRNLIKPYIQKKYKHLRRQDIKPTFFPEGSLYISKVKDFIKSRGFFGKKTIGYVIPKFYNIEIDDRTDLKIARSIAKYSKIK
tara:strand:- start:547 stop:1248 length:702 start_codon:yes stop_codon:yes gene_type:complete